MAKISLSHSVGTGHGGVRMVRNGSGTMAVGACVVGGCGVRGGGSSGFYSCLNKVHFFGYVYLCTTVARGGGRENFYE